DCGGSSNSSALNDGSKLSFGTLSALIPAATGSLAYISALSSCKTTGTVLAMTAMTIFLGKLLGLYFIAISLGMLANRERTLHALDEMARNGPWMLFSGMVATAIGLAIILGHGDWSDGALGIAINLAGWGALIKGLVLLSIPHRRIADAYQA